MDSSTTDLSREASLTPADSSSYESIEDVLNEKYFLELMGDVVKENNVEKMAIFLKVPQHILSPLKRDYSHDVPLLATKVLVAWRQNLQCETVMEAIAELAEALAKSNLARKSTLLQSLKKSKTSTPPSGPVHITLEHIEENSTTISRVVEGPLPLHKIKSQTQGTLFPTPEIKKRCTRRKCGWIACYSVLGLLVLATVAGIPSLKTTPKTSHSVSPSSVRKNDTVELSFNLPSTWFETVSLSIDKGCTAEAFTHQGKCSDLYHTARVCFNQSEFSGSRTNYLLPGSYLNFTATPNYQSTTNVWITWNPELLPETNYSRFSCDSPPPQTVCLHPETERTKTTNLIYPVVKAAYYAYFISPRPAPPDSLTLVRRICTYNVTRLKETATSTTQKLIKSDPVDVDILYKPFRFTDACTILHVQQDDHECPGFSGGKLSVETKRRQDIMLFPVLLAVLATVALILVAISHIVCTVRQRRRTGTIYHRLANTSTEV